MTLTRQTPMRRTGFAKPEAGISASLPFAAKPRPCKACAKPFVPAKPMQVVCGPSCAYKLVRLEKVAERAENKRRKDALKRPNEWRSEAQDEFNKFVRMRDANLPCISCGSMNPEMKPGGQWDAGHFLGRGAYPELAFNEDNCHKQCKSCNAGSGKFSHKAKTVAQKYEIELEKRIGAERLALLKGPHPPKKYTVDDYKSLKIEYRQKWRALEKEMA